MHSVRTIDDITFGMKVKHGTVVGMSDDEINVLIDLCLSDAELANRFLGCIPRDEKEARFIVETQLRVRKPLEEILERELTFQKFGEHKVKAAEQVVFEVTLLSERVELVEGEMYGLTTSFEFHTTEWKGINLPDHDEKIELGGPKYVRALLKGGEVVGFLWTQENYNNWKLVFVSARDAGRLVKTFKWCRQVFDTHRVNEDYPTPKLVARQ